MLSTVFLILALSLLADAQRDDHFSSLVLRNMDAYYVAQAGLSYYQALHPTTAVVMTLPDPSLEKTFSLSVDSTGTVWSIGTVSTLSGQVLAQRTLSAPQANVGNFRDATQ